HVLPEACQWKLLQKVCGQVLQRVFLHDPRSRLVGRDFRLCHAHRADHRSRELCSGGRRAEAAKEGEITDIDNEGSRSHCADIFGGAMDTHGCCHSWRRDLPGPEMSKTAAIAERCSWNAEMQELWKYLPLA